MRLKLSLFICTLLLCSTLGFATTVSATNILSPNTDSCDVIAFKNGKMVRAKVTGVLKNEIQFTLCETTDKQGYRNDTKDVLSILYSNGKIQTFDNPQNDSKDKPVLSDWEQRTNQKAIIFGIIALCSAVIGLFFAGLLFGGLAFILGIIGAIIAYGSRKKTGQTVSLIGAAVGLVIVCLTLFRVFK
jgi:hypothetical protein